jgi:F420-dependent oxidoreductase-like protein
MRFGLQLPRFESPAGPDQIGPAFARMAIAAEDAGFDSFWVMDHFFQLPFLGPAEQNMLEGYSALAYAAAVTNRIKLGTLVTGVTYRHPGVLVKTVTTLDVLSGGRAYFGIGAGWFEREHLGLGVPFPPTSERFARLEETLQIAKQMWSDDQGPYNGQYYQLAETINVPPALSRPHPPILIGGNGERKTLRLVARYADACNFLNLTPAEVEHKLNVLRQHCDEVGRDFDEIEITSHSRPIAPQGAFADQPALASYVLSPDQAVEEFSQLRDLGVQHIIIPATLDYPEMTDLIAAEVMPRVGSQPVAA